MSAFVSGAAISVRPSAAASSFCAVRRTAVATPVIRRAAVTMNLETIQVRITEAIKTAEATTKGTKEAAIAWDIVEELEAEASHLKAQGKKEPLEEYCEEVPEADECRVYED